eukprot:EG_transcript_3883
MAWEPLDDFMNELTAAMDLGEMIHTDDFNLAEVMSAVEIMDPKMDGGFGLLKAQQLEEMVDAGAVLSRPTDAQAVEVMDQLLAAEFTWFSGYALPQTLYTCIYVHRPALLCHDALSVYLKAILKACAVTCAAVNRADIREDEEFIPVIFTVDLCSEDSIPSILEEMEAVAQDLEVQAKQPGADAAVLKALLHRLQHRKYYLKALSLLMVEDRSPMENLKEVADVLGKCREHLVAISADRSPDARGSSVDLPPGAFSDHCVRWVASPSPMLPIQLQPWEQTQAAALKYLNDLQWICRVGKCQSLPQLLQFLQFYSERRANVPARSFLWLSIYSCLDYRILNRDVLQNFVLKSLEVDYGAPLYYGLAYDPLPAMEDGLPTVPHQQRELIFRWTDKASSCIWLIMHALCSNRSRLRRKLANVFPELGAWQHQSYETDGAIFGAVEPVPELQEIYTRCFVLTAYTYEVVLWAMSFYLLLGCELELYKQAELKAIYWYIDYLITMRFENFGLLHKVQDTEVEKARDRPAKGKKRRPEPALHIAYASRVKTRPPALVHVSLEAHYCLSRALVRFLDVLARDGLHSEDAKTPLGDPALVFNNRLKPFLFLMRPQFVRYETYLQHADASTHQTAELLGSAVDLLKRCKLVLEGTVAVLHDEQHTLALNALLKVAKANLVCLQLYQQGHAQGKEVELDWTVSPHFPVIKFRKKLEKIG